MVTYIGITKIKTKISENKDMLFIRNFYAMKGSSIKIAPHLEPSTMLKRLTLLLVTVLFILFFSSMEVRAQNFYCVRSGASGNNSGSDWNNAFASLPATLVRRATYYIADGNYPSYKIDDAVSGSDFITIKKATQSDHGTNIGWNSGYGDGVANWTPPIILKTDYIIFNGVTGGGPGSWESGHGFKLYSTSDVPFFNFGDKYGFPRRDVNYVIISHTEIDGGTAIAGTGFGIQSSAYETVTSNIKIEYCYIHDIYIPLKSKGGTTWLIQYNRIARNSSSPSHHGVGLRFDDAQDITFRWNRMSDIIGTGWLGGYGGSVHDFYIYGNEFFRTSRFSDGTGLGIIFSNGSSRTNVDNWQVHNNSLYNIKNGNFVILNSPSARADVYAYNNVFWDGDKSVSFKLVNEHDYSYFGSPPGGDSEPNDQTSSNDPYEDSTSYDFHLSRATEAGKSLDGPYNIDMFGNTRGVDGVWDRGAHEYGGGGSIIKIIPPTPTPISPKNVKVFKVQ